MEIKRTKRKGIKIEHNKTLFLIIIILIVLLIIVIYFILHGRDNVNNSKEENYKECINDEDCVPEICCHAASCVSKDKAPNCGNLFCTMECIPDTMDCGQGKCRCINGKCDAVFGE